MSSDRKTAILVGIFFLISYAGIFIGQAISSPILNDPDYLSILQPKKTLFVTGVLIELLNDAAVIGIVVMLFPLLRRHNEPLALGWMGFRLIEVVSLVVGKISVLSLLNVSEGFIKAGAPEASWFQAMGAAALGERQWAGQMTMIFFTLGGVLFYFLLYRSKILPRFIPVWGFLALASLIVGNLLVTPEGSGDFQAAQILFLPIILNELLIAVWLLAKGFNIQESGTGSMESV